MYRRRSNSGISKRFSFALRHSDENSHAFVYSLCLFEQHIENRHLRLPDGIAYILPPLDSRLQERQQFSKRRDSGVDVSSHRHGLKWKQKIDFIGYFDLLRKAIESWHDATQHVVRPKVIRLTNEALNFADKVSREKEWDYGRGEPAYCIPLFNKKSICTIIHSLTMCLSCVLVSTVAHDARRARRDPVSKTAKSECSCRIAHPRKNEPAHNCAQKGTKSCKQDYVANFNLSAPAAHAAPFGVFCYGAILA